MSTNTTPGNSLADEMPAQCIENVRDALAVIAAALSSPPERWDRFDVGVIRLLADVDGALEALALEIAPDPDHNTNPGA